MKHFHTQTAGRIAGFDYAPTLRDVLVGFLGVALFAGLTFLGTLVRIPLQPVPITLQTMFVLLAGAILGAKRGSISECSYVVLGAAGMPLFAGHTAGPSILLGPTGGYLAAFIVAPLIIGRLITKSQALGWHILVFSLGSAFILAAGTLYLAVAYTHSLGAALAVGVLPFIPGEIFKIAAATSIYRSYSALARRGRNRS